MARTSRWRRASVVERSLAECAALFRPTLADHGQKHETGNWMHSELDDRAPITEEATERKSYVSAETAFTAEIGGEQTIGGQTSVRPKEANLPVAARISGKTVVCEAKT